MAPNLILQKCSKLWATECSVSPGAYSGLPPDPAINSLFARTSIAHLDLGKGKNSIGLGAPLKAFCLMKAALASSWGFCE